MPLRLSAKITDTASPGFAKFAANVQPAIRRVLRRELPRLESEVRAGVPVLTGELRDSFVARVFQGGAVVGTRLNRARFIEFGTVRQPAQPFVRPAVARVQPGYLSQLFAAFRGAVP